MPPLFPVATPSTTVSAGRYLCAIRAHEAELKVQDGAAKVMQSANRKHQHKRQVKGATKIQAGFRGKKARQGRNSNDAAKAARASVARTTRLGSAIQDVYEAPAHSPAAEDGGGAGATTEEMNEAAAKIQAHLRGKAARKVKSPKKSMAQRAAEQEARESVLRRAQFAEAKSQRSSSESVFRPNFSRSASCK